MPVSGHNEENRMVDDFGVVGDAQCTGFVDCGNQSGRGGHMRIMGAGDATDANHLPPIQLALTASTASSNTRSAR